MPDNRFTAEQIVENVNEADGIFVPGVKVFDMGGLNSILNPPAGAPATGAINISILLNKFPWWYRSTTDITLKPKFNVRRGNNYPKPYYRNYKNEMLADCARLSAGKPAMYCDHKARHYSAPDGASLITEVLKTKTRLIVGMSGSSSVFETAIELHPYFGFPVIPASSVKGATRHYCKEFRSDIDAMTRKAIFGHEPTSSSNMAEGGVVFYDAWPDEWPTKGERSQPLLEVDVMTPHYPDYYSEGSTTLPADNQDPDIIHFLTVKKSVRFRFAVRQSSSCERPELASTALSLIKEALTTTGIGAKTGSSYGYFTP